MPLSQPWASSVFSPSPPSSMSAATRLGRPPQSPTEGGLTFLEMMPVALASSADWGRVVEQDVNERAEAGRPESPALMAEKGLAGTRAIDVADQPRCAVGALSGLPAVLAPASQLPCTCAVPLRQPVSRPCSSMLLITCREVKSSTRNCRSSRFLLSAAASSDAKVGVCVMKAEL